MGFCGLRYGTAGILLFGLFSIAYGETNPGLFLPSVLNDMELQFEAHQESAETSYPSLHIIGFSDLNFFASDDSDPEVNSGFFEGQFVLHFTSLLSSKISFVGEVSLTARRDASTTSSVSGFNAEVERSIIRYSHSDRLKISAGRYHTPINYWNVAYHHGQWLQTSISRPEMVRFGGQYIPVHFVGLLLEGSHPAGGYNLNYGVGVGNGRSTIISRAGDALDVNNNRAWLASAFIKPDGFYGLQAGGAFYSDKITTSDTHYRESISSFHLIWTKETPEVLMEYAYINHQDLRIDENFHNHAYYIQFSYRLPVSNNKWKPYYRFEDIRIDKNDVAFSGVRPEKGSIIGVRYDFAELVALKAEYRRKHTKPTINSIFAQVSFTF